MRTFEEYLERQHRLAEMKQLERNRARRRRQRTREERRLTRNINIGAAAFAVFIVVMAILAQHLERYGTMRDALTAYNSGSPGNSKYATAILANAEKWRGQ